MADETVKKSETRSAERGEMTPHAERSSVEGGRQGAETVSDVDIERNRERGAEGEVAKKSARSKGT